MKKRIWIDTITMAFSSKEALEKRIDKGQPLVISNTAIDVAVFQENISWFKKQLSKQTILVEIWHTPNEMTKRPFFWTSCQQETPAASTLEEAVAELPNAKEILRLSELLNFYGIPKGMICMTPVTPLKKETARILGIEKTATRTDVLAAAKAANRMDLFDEYNIEYIRGLAIQHCCDAILRADGKLTKKLYD